MIAPFGTWKSPISAADVAAGALRLEVVAVDRGSIYWLEGRPMEGGRYVLVRQDSDGRIADVTPPGTNVRTRVHEYGGGACLVSDGTVYYSEFSNQRLHRLVPGSAPAPLTPAGDWFYADAAMHPSRTWLVGVREDHSRTDAEPITTLVKIAADGDGTAGEIIASGYDFYSTPRFTAEGSRMCWLAWRHPQMPWDGTEVWVADVDASGRLRSPQFVAGGPGESIVQPGWSPDGVLHFVSDRSGWWNLYRWREGRIEALCPMEAEFAGPQWVFGATTWAFSMPHEIIVSCNQRGQMRLARLDAAGGTLRPIHTTREPGNVLLATDTDVVCAAGSSRETDAIARINISTGATDIIRTASGQSVDAVSISDPLPMDFRTEEGLTAHAFYYPPRNRECSAPEGERPPLIVISHGGPTSAASTRFNREVQYWTTRGFAVVDVDYGGSSGYGRAYRQRLNGQWGIVDVDDCVNAARHLVREGKADPKRLSIRGRSAGGYTTLAALTFRPDVFNAGASYYGVSDVEALAKDTHKFESRYLDTLIGPYPAMQEVYRARSPIHVVDRLACPIILLQGLEDKVVPPNQAIAMAQAVRAKGLHVVLLLFEGEQHGFRKTDTIVECLLSELAFYGEVFGFTPSESSRT